MKESTRNFLHRVDGPLGAILIAICVGWTGYVIRGYEDGGLVASLMERIHSARMDERTTQQSIQAQQIKGYQERADIRDQQVAFLISQNKLLITLFVKATKERNSQLAQLKALADKSATAAVQAKATAASTELKADEVSKKVDTIASAVAAASAPRAVPVHPTVWPWSKGH